MEDVAAPATAVPSHPQEVTLVSQTSSASQFVGNVGGPLRSSSSESSSGNHCRSTGECSLVPAARTTSPFYRHNPYLASPVSETYLYLASPDGTGLEEAVERHRSSSNSSHHNNIHSIRNSNDRSADVTSDWRLVVRSLSRRKPSSSVHSTADNDNSNHHHHYRSRTPLMSPAFMNPLENKGVSAMEDAAAAQRGHARRDSAASLSCDNSTSSAVLYSCAESSAASHHASPSPGQIASLTRAPAFLFAAAAHTRRRTESPETSRHSTLSKSHSWGSPTTSSLYYSFTDHSAAAAISTSNNPYVGVRMTPEAPAALAANQDGVSPYSPALQQQQRLSMIPRVSSNNSSGAVIANVVNGGGEAGSARGSHRRTPTIEGLPLRMARVGLSASSHSTTTAQNSPGAVASNSTSETAMTTATPPAYVASTAAAAAAQAPAAARLTVTPRSHPSDTPPPYNQPTSAPLSPDTASMIVPPSPPPAMTLRQSRPPASAGGLAGLPTYAMSSDVVLSEVSSNSSPHQPYRYTPLARQSPWPAAAVRTPPPPQSQPQQSTFMPPSRAAYAMTASPPPYVYSSSDNDEIRFLHAMDSGTPPPAPTTTAANTAMPTMTGLSHNTGVKMAAMASPPPYDGLYAAPTAAQSDVLSDGQSPSKLRTFGGRAEEDGGERLYKQSDRGGGAAAAAATTVMMRTHDEQAVTTAAEAGNTNCGPSHPRAQLDTFDEEQHHQQQQQQEAAEMQETIEESQMQRNPATQEADRLHGAMTNEISDEEDAEDDGEEGATLATSVNAGAAAAADTKAKHKKKKRARRNRKQKFLQELPPATEMKFLPPPPPPLPAPHDGAETAAPGSKETAVDFDKYYGVLVRWYERILADEADFVGSNSASLPLSVAAAQASGNGVASLEASHTTLQNSGTLTPRTSQTMTGSMPDAIPGTTVFAMTNFNGSGAAATTTTPTTNNPHASSAAARLRHTTGGGEVPVLCPRIEQYMPLSDIPLGLRTGVPNGSGTSVRRYSLQSTGSSVESPATVHGGETAAAAAPVLHVQHVDRAVQWAAALNSWWLAYVHPHSFSSRRQRIPPGFPMPPIPTATAAAAATAAAFPSPNTGSNMGSMDGWSASSTAVTGYEGQQQQQPFYGSGGMGGGGAGMQVMSGSGSVAATATSNAMYAGLPLSSYSPYSPYSIPGMAPPPPPLQQQPQMQQLSHPSIMGVYTIYQHQ
ncbi:hypothetical protein ABB37_07179 [Leptomonas pyrrhocoris]|uniref:Uncharacterized protein n=1 Tax=Leptomonas pyrrhocoris TaxID=157538 RepID=A0A0N0DTC4_LEPPY|nr:hypothetical protein ABB37_07179 [Leptomonas pyrrhocoris]KPA77288.1 hypothetical protein ABB37_07179 [Leptomonas pyrrhocoris]|eukprot:XP_015655727.1 hypothetical protein ABB37_07179 [Leptomonas pyrrhocoris]